MWGGSADAGIWSRATSTISRAPTTRVTRKTPSGTANHGVRRRKLTGSEGIGEPSRGRSFVDPAGPTGGRRSWVRNGALCVEPEPLEPDDLGADAEQGHQGRQRQSVAPRGDLLSDLRERPPGDDGQQCVAGDARRRSRRAEDVQRVGPRPGPELEPPQP